MTVQPQDQGEQGAGPRGFEPLTQKRRRQQTREYLLRAAEQVFAERGFHGASLDEVAAVAGFTKGAVYSNFKNKEDLFLALLESRYEEEMRQLRETIEATRGSPEVQLEAFVAMLKQGYESGGDLWATLDLEFTLYATRNPAARQKLAAFRRMDVDQVAGIIAVEREREGIESGEAPADAARIVVALMRGLNLMRMIDPESVSERFLEDVMSFLFRALTS